MLFSLTLITWLSLLPLASLAHAAPASAPACRPFLAGQSNFLEVPKESKHLTASPDGRYTAIATNDKVLINGASSDTPQKIEQEGFKTAEFSRNGRHFVSGWANGKVVLRNLENGREAIIDHSKLRPDIAPGTIGFRWNNVTLTDGGHSIAITRFSNDSTRVASVSKNGTLVITNLKDGTQKAVPCSPTVRDAHFTPDGKRLVSIAKDGTAAIIDVASGTSREFKNAKAISADGRFIFSDKGIEQLSATKQTRTIALKVSQKNATARFSDSGRWLSIMTQNFTEFVNPLTGDVVHQIPGGGRHGIVQFSADESRVLIASGRSPVEIRNLATGRNERTIPIDGQAEGAFFSKDGSQVLLTIVDDQKNPKVLLVDLKTGVSQTLPHTADAKPAYFAPDGRIVTRPTEKTAQFTSPALLCVDDTLTIADDPCTNCREKYPLSAKQLRPLSDLARVELCEKTFIAREWEPFTPLRPPRPLTQDAVEHYLHRFQKPGGFEPQKHLPVLLAILRSDLPAKKPELLSGSLAGVLHSSNEVYDRLLDEFPRLKALSPTGGSLCATSKERDLLAASAWSYFRRVKALNPDKTTLDQWRKLFPLAPVLAALPENQKENAIDTIAQALADAAADDPRFAGVFNSKLYKFGRQVAYPLFGKPRNAHLPDLSLIHGNGVRTPVLLATSTIDGDATTLSPYGFYFKRLPDIPIPPDAPAGKRLYDNEVRWQVGDQTFHARLDIRAGTKRASPIPPGKGPDYAGLFKDGNRHGVVVTGANLEDEITANVLKEYRAYYEASGFRFEEAEQPVADVHGYLKTEISRGHTDYLIKEAHSDGDEKNLFRLPRSGKILRGTKTNPDGTTESIDLITPTSDKSHSVLLANEEFGNWNRDRKAAGKEQLVYFNTSCNSITKAIYEVEATNDPILLDIPASSIVNPFRNEADSGEYQLLHSFLARKNYAEMREALNNAPSYKDGKANVFVFPDEPHYQKTIGAAVSQPLQIAPIRVLNERGEEVNIDGH